MAEATTVGNSLKGLQAWLSTGFLKGLKVLLDSVKL